MSEQPPDLNSHVKPIPDEITCDEIMCPCSGTKRSKIQQLFEQGMDAEAISRQTGALTGCGGCEWDIAQLLNEFAEKSNLKPIK